MTEPRAIDDINRYLAELNSALAVGLRSRSRILEEACEHLYEAAMAEHEELLAQIERRELPARPGEALWAEAQRRAIAAFGSPEEVASGFQSGPLGVLDRHLAAADARFEGWVARRPVLAGTVWAAVTSLAWVALGVAISLVGYLFGIGYAVRIDALITPGHTVDVLSLFVWIGVVYFCMRMVYVLRGNLAAGGLACWRGLPLKQPRAVRLVALRDWLGYMFFMGYVLLTHPMSFIQLTAAWIALALVVELAARLARRMGRGAGWSVYGADPDENWSRYVSGLWTSAGVTLTLIVVVSGPSGLALALALLLAAVTGTTALLRRLGWNSSVKRSWGRTYEARAGR